MRPAALAMRMPARSARDARAATRPSGSERRRRRDARGRARTAARACAGARAAARQPPVHVAAAERAPQQPARAQPLRRKPLVDLGASSHQRKSAPRASSRPKSCVSSPPLRPKAGSNAQPSKSRRRTKALLVRRRASGTRAPSASAPAREAARASGAAGLRPLGARQHRAEDSRRRARARRGARIGREPRSCTTSSSSTKASQRAARRLERAVARAARCCAAARAGGARRDRPASGSGAVLRRLGIVVHHQHLDAQARAAASGARGSRAGARGPPAGDRWRRRSRRPRGL